MICIGPVCVPVSALWALAALALRPLWVRLPPNVRAQLTAFWNVFTDKISPITNFVKPYYDKLPSIPIPFLNTKVVDKSQHGPIIDKLLIANHVADILKNDNGGGVFQLADVETWHELLKLSLSSKFAIVVDFGAPTCVPCKEFVPIFERYSRLSQALDSKSMELLSSSQVSRLLFVYVDVSSKQAVAQACLAHTKAIPYMQLWKNGENVYDEEAPDELDLLEACLHSGISVKADHEKQTQVYERVQAKKKSK